MFINDDKRKGCITGKRGGEKKETVTRGSTTSTLFHLLKLNGLFCYTKTLQNARLNLSHKTLIVDWLLNALEAREKIAGSPSTVWHETPASFLFFFPCFIPFQVEIMLLVLTLRQCEIWSCSIRFDVRFIYEKSFSSVTKNITSTKMPDENSFT